MTNETQAILNLQRYLRQLSRFDPAIPIVDEDGIFGEETRASLSAFQKKYGLPITGIADLTTWTRLFNAYLADVEARTRPDPIYIFPRTPPDYSVGRGDQNLLVELIQQLLRDIAIYYGQDGDRLPVDGKFGEQTEQAIRDFQRVQSLPQTGRVDRITWNRLLSTTGARVNELLRE